MTDPRRTYAYQKARRAWLPIAGDVCCLCGLHVDKTLPGSHPQGPTVEHTVDVVHAPWLALDVSLWALAHRACNARKGASLGGRRLAAQLGRTPRSASHPSWTSPSSNASRRW